MEKQDLRRKASTCSLVSDARWQ